MNNKISFSWNLLRYVYGVVILLAGLDKIAGTNFITNWAQYIAPQAAAVLPMTTETFLLSIGIVEVVIALLILTKFQQVGGYLAAVWLVLIAGNLLLLGTKDIAIRDLMLAAGAVVLANLTEVVRSVDMA